MKNHLNTQERSPNLTESKQPPVLVYLWLLIFGIGALAMAISAVAIVSLTNTGRIEKDPAKQTTVATQTPVKNQSNSSPNWLLTIVLLGAGVASAGAIYRRRHDLPTFAKPRLTRRQQRKRSLKQGESTVVTPEIPPIEEALIINLEAPPEPLQVEVPPKIAVLPPEEDPSSNLGGQSLAEKMDIRKHLSLSTILQDFKRHD